LKGAFVVGASGAAGFSWFRDRKTATWAGQLFTRLARQVFGFQAGGEASEVILLAMTDGESQRSLGIAPNSEADVGVTVGPVGYGSSSFNRKPSADIVSFCQLKKGCLRIAVDGLW